jgi:uncharacterized membrane protein
MPERTHDDYHEDEDPVQFIVHPNRSLSREGMIFVFALITTVLLIVAAAFTFVGAWLIFPFSGLEAFVFGGVFLWFFRHYDDHEYIVINHNSITVTRRIGGQESVYRFERYWARLTVEYDTSPWRPPHLFLGSHGTRLEIATDLSGEERLDFARHLREAIRRPSGA